MTRIFIDTLYWIARINPRDQWHERTIQATAAIDPFQGVQILTHDNHFAQEGFSILL
jgi:hypothetical protein